MANIQTARKKNTINSVVDAKIRNEIRSRVLYLMAEKRDIVSRGCLPSVESIKMVLLDYDLSGGIIFDYLLLSMLDSVSIADLDSYKFDDLVKEDM